MLMKDETESDDLEKRTVGDELQEVSGHLVALMKTAMQSGGLWGGSDSLRLMDRVRDLSRRTRVTVASHDIPEEDARALIAEYRQLAATVFEHIKMPRISTRSGVN